MEISTEPGRSAWDVEIPCKKMEWDRVLSSSKISQSGHRVRERSTHAKREAKRTAETPQASTSKDERQNRRR